MLKEIELAHILRTQMIDQAKASFQNKNATDQLMRKN